MSRVSKRDVNHGGGGSSRVLGNNKTSGFSRLPKDPRLSPPVRLLMQLGAKVASAIRDVSMRKRPSRKVISSSSSTLLRSYSLSDHTDSHRAAAVEDCIQFLHSSSSRERPN